MSIEVVAAIIFFKKKILVTKRKFHKNLAFSYKYEFPGGKVEKNEDKLKALKRELLEELDLKVENFRHFSSYDKNEIKLHFFFIKHKRIKINAQST